MMAAISTVAPQAREIKVDLRNVAAMLQNMQYDFERIKSEVLERWDEKSGLVEYTADFQRHFPRARSVDDAIVWVLLVRLSVEPGMEHFSSEPLAIWSAMKNAVIEEINRRSNDVNTHDNEMCRRKQHASALWGARRWPND